MKQCVNNIVLSVCVAFLMSGCHSRPDHTQPVAQLPAIYPDYIGVTVPVDMAPLNFAMADDGFTDMDVVVQGHKTGSIHANGADADFDLDEWHQLLADNKGSRLTFTVCARKDGKWLQYRDFEVSVSSDSLGAWGITYRRIAPGYALYGHMGIYQRCLSDFEETSLLENSLIPGHCVNCHTQNRTNPEQYVFHVRGQHGATVIHRPQGTAVLPARNDTLGGSMVYPYWHPGGRYCAFSTNKTAQMFHMGHHKRIEVFDASSDVFVYDTETQTVIKDTLTMTEGWAENTPAFSPDGKWLYFTTARCGHYPQDYNQVKYSLCRVGFDASSGSLGTQVDTLVSSAVTGKSVTWPRPSYDGRYLMYTQLDYGYFSVWHPEADLWLMDMQTGETRALTEVNSDRSESLHHFTLSSRWFLFTSRRDDGLYTRIYFSSIDEKGRATKPVLLPQRHPKTYYRRLMYSYNTPDFTLCPVGIDAREMVRRIVNR